MNARSSENNLKPTNSKPDENTERLLQLSSEVGRIASSLAMLSISSADLRSASGTGGEEDLIQAVRTEIRRREARQRYFPNDLFGEPAWDMLLHLLHVELLGVRITTSALCQAAGTPQSTAFRALDKMISRRMVVRRSDPHHHRRAFIELERATSHALRSYFAERANG